MPYAISISNYKFFGVTMKTIIYIFVIGSTIFVSGLFGSAGAAGAAQKGDGQLAVATYTFTYQRSQTPIEPAELFNSREDEIQVPGQESLNSLFMAGSVSVDSVSLADSGVVVVSGSVGLECVVQNTKVAKFGTGSWMREYDFTLEYLGSDVGVRTSYNSDGESIRNVYLDIVLREICAPGANALQPGVYGEFKESANRSGVRVVSRGIIPMVHREDTNAIPDNYVIWAFRGDTSWPTDIYRISDSRSLHRPNWVNHTRLNAHASE